MIDGRGNRLALVLLLLGGAAQAAEQQYKGELEYEHYWFPSPLDNPAQADRLDAVKLRLEAGWKLDEHWSAAAQPFVRRDAHDSGRDTARFDEAWVQYATPDWDLRVGNQLVTWGSMESVSPVDVVNPRDFNEDIADPDKIGVPAARLRIKRGGSDLSVYSLPYYRSSEFPGAKSFYSIGGGLPSAEPGSRWTPQWAARWFVPGSGFDLGLSWFRGYERTPLFGLTPSFDAVVGRAYRSERFGAELTKVIGELILKGEVVRRIAKTEGVGSTWLYAAGIEYTKSPVWRQSDLTLFAEYLGQSGAKLEFPSLKNHVFLGARWNGKDPANQLAEAGVLRSFDHRRTYLYRIKYERDLRENLRLGLHYTNSFGFFFDPHRDEDEDGALRVFVRLNF